MPNVNLTKQEINFLFHALSRLLVGAGLGIYLEPIFKKLRNAYAKPE